MHNIDLDKNKIVLGISGGVDSTTAALLLLEKGYEVYGLYFNIHDDGEQGRASALRALTEAYAAKNPVISMDEVENKYFIYRNVKSEFERIVIEDFCNEYMNGRTPNPCIVCNPAIKFRLLAEAADEKGAFYIATGHYAGIYMDTDANKAYIKVAASRKDQSYMLYRLPQKILKRIIFPLAEFESKSMTRELAESMGMSNAKLSDSQEICFVENGCDHGDYIKEWADKSTKGLSINSIDMTPLQEGNFTDKMGNVLGKHKGIVNYTIGQRKKLGIALGKPAFVTEINPNDNTIVLGENEELFKTHAIIDNIFFSETDGVTLPNGITEKELTAKVRYAAPRAAAKICLSEESSDTLEIVFDVPQRAMTPGQSIVLYDGDIVIGGGRILKTI